MDQFFVKDYTGAPFQLFGLPHLISLAIITSIVCYVLNLKRISDVKLNVKFRYTLASTLFTNEIGWHVWNFFTDQWTIQKMLPLHLCGTMVWCSIILLLTKKYAIYEFVYFLGIGGAVQSLLTPDVAQYGFPHYRFFQFFISHGSILIAAIYMTIVEGYRPVKKSLLRIVIWANLYMIFVYIVNRSIGANYMFTVQKPDTPSMLDFFGPWPLYILGIEVIGLIMLFLFYLPFAIHDWKTQLNRSATKTLRHKGIIG